MSISALITGIAHVGIRVHALDRARAFYEFLGFPRNRRSPGGSAKRARSGPMPALTIRRAGTNTPIRSKPSPRVRATA